MSTSGTGTTARSKWHWPKVVLFLAIFLASCYFAVSYCIKAHNTYEAIQRIPAADSQKFTDGIKAGIAHTSDASQSLAQTLLLIAAALWGVIIGKEDERKIILGTYLSTAMAVGANLVIGLFMYSYHLLDTVISQILYKAALVGTQEYIINLNAMKLSDLFSYQLTIFVAAASAIGSTLLCAHTLKEN